MKKLIAIILALTLATVALTSCGVAGVEDVKACYANSNPTEIVVVAKQEFAHVFSTTTTIRSGYIYDENGDREAVAIKTVKGEVMNTIEDGSGVDVIGVRKSIDTTEYYRESLGVSSDFGVTYDKDIESFVPARGGMAINLDNTSVIKNATFSNNTMKFTLSAADAPTVFPKLETAIKADALVTITVAGGVVTGIRVEWTIPVNTETGVDEMKVSVDATYKYDIVNINMQ